MPRDASAKDTLISNSESRILNHQIYTGSFAALEMRWMETVAELQRDDPLGEVNILIGSNVLASYLKRRIAESGRTAANLRFHTFLDLVSRLAGNPAIASARPHLPKLGATILLESILAERVPEIFAGLSGYKGFRDSLLETFRDLRDAGIRPDELVQSIQAGRRAPDRKKHLEGFAELYRRFREQAGRFHDVDDDFRMAIHQATRLQSASGSSCLLIYGIYDATGQQSRLLAALKHSLSMIYFVPFVNAVVSEFARPFLESRVEELGVLPLPLSPPPVNTSLGQLAANDFGFARESTRGPALAADGSVSMLSAPGESRAALEIVREIFQAVRDGAISGFHEAAVVLRQPEADLPILAEMLRLRGIPYFIHGGGRFADRPVSKAVLALSGLEGAAFSREAILIAMEFIAASLPESSADSWDVQGWRVLTNDPRFLAGLRSWDTATKALVEHGRREIARLENQGEGNEESDSSAMSIGAARKQFASAQCLREAWQLVRSAAANWPDSLSWLDWAHFLEQRFEPILKDSPDWPRFLTVLDDITNLKVLDQFEVRDPRSALGCSSQRLRSALKESIESLTYPVGRFQRSGVNLLSASSARGLRFPLVIIPGLDEGRFPSKLRQDPLLPDSERRQMKNLPLKAKRTDEEKLLFDMAARSATKRLVLMNSRLDESSDRERIPSQFFLRVAAAIRGNRVSMRDLTGGKIPGFRSISLDAPAPESDAVAVDESEIRLRLITLEKNSGRQALEALVSLDPSRLKRPLDYDQSRWKSSLTQFDGRIADPQLIQWTARKIGTEAGQVSASRFEEYAKCPYYFFLKRVQGLESWEEQGKVEGMDPLERGTAIHAILESFIKECVGESFTSVPESKLRSLLEQKARAELENAHPPGMPDLLWEIERDALIDVLQEWLQFEIERTDGSLRIARLEQPFGNFSGEKSFPPFKVPVGKHTFDFRGRIDRVDITHDGTRARVIDYKTGMLPDSMNRKLRPLLMGGERIQLAIYRGALSVLEGFGELVSVDAEYLYLQPRDRQIRLCRFSHDELQVASKALPRILQILGAGMESGIFFARTSGTVYPSGHCDYCDFLTICGKDRAKREMRKSADPSVIGFLEILEPQHES